MKQSAVSKDIVSGTKKASKMAGHIQQLNELLDISKRYNLIDIANQIKDRKRDASLPALVVVAGEGNFGKSSLINALAGKTIAPVSAIPLTWKVDVYRLSASGDEYAEVRYVGEDTYRTVSIDQAHLLCKDEEARLRSKTLGLKPEIVEVIWHHTNLAFGHNICLVDTPGLEAAGLGVDVQSNRLVQGLGAVYSIDEVWHYYYHKADLVVWAFDASKLESKGTYNTIERLTSLQQKPIAAVVTKADKIEQARWQEIHERYHKNYKCFFKLGLSDRLFLTVCGGTTPLVGTGVNDIRHYLESDVAPRANDIKLEATERFCADTSREILKILRLSAKQFNDNLRIMADTADEIALRLMAIVSDHLTQASQVIDNHIGRLVNGLHGYLYPVVVQAIKSRDMSGVGLAAQRYISLSIVENEVNTKLQLIGTQVTAIAAALSSQRKLNKLTLKVGGLEEHESFQFVLDVSAPAPVNYRVAHMEMSPISLGFLAALGRFLKGLFGHFSLTAQEEQQFDSYIWSLRSQLYSAQSDSKKQFVSHLRNSVAPALLRAVTVSLTKTISSDTTQIISMLDGVDRDVRQLITFSGESREIPPQYANWAKYWIAEHRNVDMARRLVVDVLWPHIDPIKEYISHYSRSKNTQPQLKERFKVFYKQQGRNPKTIVDNEQDKSLIGVSKSLVSKCFTAYFNCGAKPAITEHQLSLIGILKAMETDTVTTGVVSGFRDYAGQEPLLQTVTEQITQTIPDVVVHELSQTYSSILTAMMARELNSQAARPIRSVISSTLVFGYPLSITFYQIPCALMACSPLTIPLIVMSPWIGLASLLGLITISALFLLYAHNLLKYQMKLETWQQTQLISDAWVRSSAAATADNINELFFNELTSKLVIQLSPRPLQRLANGEL